MPNETDARKTKSQVWLFLPHVVLLSLVSVLHMLFEFRRFQSSRTGQDFQPLAVSSLRVLGTSVQSELKSEKSFCSRVCTEGIQSQTETFDISRECSALSAGASCNAIPDSWATSVRAVKQFNIVPPL